MASDRIKLDFTKAAEMRKTFNASKEQLEATIKEMQGVATTLQEGALLGTGGTTFVEAINTKLIVSLKKLAAKYKELDEDVGKAVEFMKQEDRKTASSMGS